MKLIINNHKSGIPTKNIDLYQMEISKLDLNNLKLVICPSDDQITLFKEDNYYLGSQDINSNIDNLKELKVKYTIVGHSEKRKLNNETNQEINTKIKLLLSNNITPILCVGEELDEINNIKEVIKEELVEGLKDIKTDNIIIAYEPVWAISSGHIPSNNELLDIISYIRDISIELLGKEPLIIYGGSVNMNTIDSLEKIEILDGYLIGSASLNIKELKELIEVIK